MKKIVLLKDKSDMYFDKFKDMIFAYIHELHLIDPEHVRPRTSDELIGEYFGVEDTFCCALVDNNVCVGFVILGGGKNCHPDADLYIEEFYIAESYRRKGKGQAFVAMLLEGVPSVCFFILKNNEEAKKFWQKIFGTWKDCSKEARKTIGMMEDSDWCEHHLYERRY